MSKKIYFVVCAVLAVFFAFRSVGAAEFITPQGGRGNVVLNRQMNEDTYAVGGNVSVQSGTNGDLFAAGGSVDMAGTVAQDLFLAGGNIITGGQVMGDARIAGGNISVQSQISEDLLVAGGTVNIGSGARVGRDLAAVGGSVVVNAPVDGDVYIRGGEVTINSRVAGNIDVYAEKLIFGSESQATGTIVYRGVAEAEVDQGARISNVQFEKTARTDADSKRGWGIAAALVQFAALLIGALLLTFLLRRVVGETVETAYASFLKSLGVGFVAMVVIPIAAIILFVTIVGYYVGLILLVVYAVLLLLTPLLASIFFGALIFKWAKKTKGFEVRPLTVTVGVLVYALLALIPFLGWVVMAVVCLAVLGALILVGWRRRVAKQ